MLIKASENGRREFRSDGQSGIARSIGEAFRTAWAIAEAQRVRGMK